MEADGDSHMVSEMASGGSPPLCDLSLWSAGPQVCVTIEVFPGAILSLGYRPFPP